MNTTSLSLLERLKRARADAPDWRGLQDLYLPLIRHWLGRVPGLGAEADDLAQEVFVVLVRELPSFERQRHGSFRAWLRQITVNRVRAFCKARDRQPHAGLGGTFAAVLAQLEDARSSLSRQWDQDHDHDRHVLQKLLAIVQPDFDRNTWQAFTRFALEGLAAAVVAEQLGMSENAAMLAKFRVLKRLREEARDLMD